MWLYPSLSGVFLTVGRNEKLVSRWVEKCGRVGVEGLVAFTSECLMPSLWTSLSCEMSMSSSPDEDEEDESMTRFPWLIA